MKFSYLKYTVMLLVFSAAVLPVYGQTDAPPDWTVEPGQYQYNANITSRVLINSQAVIGQNDRLAAFAGSQIRGVAAPLQFLGNWLFFLTAYTNNASEQLTLKVYLAGPDTVLTIQEAQSIVPNGIYGTVMNPVIFNASLSPAQYPELQLRAMPEGFFDEITGVMVPDTITVTLRNSAAPYTAVQSVKVKTDGTGIGKYIFTNAPGAGSYYLVVRHRNSIETWSAVGKSFLFNRLKYDFTSSAQTAYGNNMALKNGKWCLFGGDVNQDGTVDFTDLLAIDNDAFNYTSGYLATDLNGDNFIDLTDLVLTDNNSFNFVAVVKP